MPVNKSKSSRSALGDNPLAQTIFSKTEVETQPPVEVGNIPDSTTKNQDSTINNQDSTINNQDSTINNQDSTINNQDSTINNQDSTTKNQDSTINNQDSTTKNQDSTTKNQDSTTKNQDSTINNQDSTTKNQDSRFLNKVEREAVNLRLPLELNDWLNDLLKKGKRQHGAKIPKEVWVQAALELFRAMPVRWSEVDSEETLRSILLDIESRLKNTD